MSTDFYKAFEDQHLGSRDLIKPRLQVYLPFINPLLDTKQATIPKALALGCGRGEWRDLALVFNMVNIDKMQFSGCSWSQPEVKVSLL